MKYIDPYIKQLTGMLEHLWGWIQADVLTLDSAVQVSLLVGLFIAAKVMAIATAKRLENRVAPQKLSLVKIYASNQELFFLLYAVCFFWAAVVASEALVLPLYLLKIAASLMTAWAVIRFTSSTIESAFWSRLVALVLWVVAALNIMGWLAPTIEFMDKTSFQAGETKLSLLLVAKSILAFAVLLWGVRLLSGMLQSGFSKARGLTPSQKVLFFKLSNITLYIIGGLVALNIVGLDLTALAVFSGALGLGIGFGLQKVFSNLISGIILLLDKSVKPGDTIAVDDTYGWVNKLGARCVSVLTRDGKEHLIPNETLITDKVENWSYSNEKIRVHIPVGVAYSSDMKLVRELLFKAIEGHPRILENPKPNVLMRGFGDSSVDHEIRCWMCDPVEGIANLKSDIYYKVWDLFKEHGVEIPFPQRDVHLDLQSSGALDSLLQPDKKKQA